jgi:hypothetical protein
MKFRIFSILAMSNVVLAQAQVYTYYYTVAIQVWSTNTNPTNAVPAQCPADHPVSCSNIERSNLYVGLIDLFFSLSE